MDTKSAANAFRPHHPRHMQLPLFLITPAHARQFARGSGYTGYQNMIYLGRAVAGTTIGIIGMGRIGTAVAKRATGFSMKILYYNRSVLPKTVACNPVCAPAPSRHPCNRSQSAHTRMFALPSAVYGTSNPFGIGRQPVCGRVCVCTRERERSRWSVYAMWAVHTHAAQGGGGTHP